MENSYEQESYKNGFYNGQRGNFIDDLLHQNSSRVSFTKKGARGINAYDKGYEDGKNQRTNKDY